MSNNPFAKRIEVTQDDLDTTKGNIWPNALDKAFERAGLYMPMGTVGWSAAFVPYSQGFNSSGYGISCEKVPYPDEAFYWDRKSPVAFDLDLRPVLRATLISLGFLTRAGYDFTGLGGLGE